MVVMAMVLMPQNGGDFRKFDEKWEMGIEMQMFGNLMRMSAKCLFMDCVE